MRTRTDAERPLPPGRQGSSQGGKKPGLMPALAIGGLLYSLLLTLFFLPAAYGVVVRHKTGGLG